MKHSEHGAYEQRIRRRIWLQRGMIAVNLVYMFAVAFLGGGDSRIMTRLADMFSDLVIFGGIVYMAVCIHRNKKLLANRLLLKEQRELEWDERRRFLHDKSGGLVVDVLLAAQLYITCTAALFNMPAFYTAFAVLCLTAALKLGVYTYYSKTC
ncbi:MAG TPA: hypothetical protein IAB66_07535 [Candidatus Caccousia avistercoris]|nr:hypothetical protein [Candidatus Caccousia avistercoris]